MTEAIDGFLFGGGDTVTRLDGYPHIKVVVRSDWKKDKVSLISGGGSGHEPAHAGFVGRGLLTAAVCGEIFASPSVDAVLAGILAVTGTSGCLLIVKNYTGDRLNFGLAAEKARSLGIKVEIVIVDDDIALPNDIQARGIAGTVFVHKIAGALAEQGRTLEEVARAAKTAAASISSLGISLSTCSVPGVDNTERLEPGMAELGLGIHGEPGAKKIRHQTAAAAVQVVLSNLEKKIEPKAKYALLLNNLGGCTPLEMTILAREITKSKISPSVQYLYGPASLMTSLDMRGFSISILKLTKELEVSLLFPVSGQIWPEVKKLKSPKLVSMPKGLENTKWLASEQPVVRNLVLKCCDILEQKEKTLNEIDAKIGDGDTGSTLANACRSLRQVLDQLPLKENAQFFLAISEILSRSMGGSSGVLMAMMFSAAANEANAGANWKNALQGGLQRVMEMGGAKPGDRTFIDSLAPALKQLQNSSSLMEAAEAARLGADKTRDMTSARAGRAAYVPKENLIGVPDPGAEAVALIFEGIAS
ncbi:MAG: dihydroxyacetone kinase subunit DhaK [Pseudomonadota bacterium]|nr:dihydroxyacetone kinase subunit DhaK [Pseudomonadota bacterium]